MKKKLLDAVFSGLGVGVGTLVYTRFLSAAQQFDWERSIFVGVFCAVASLVLAKVRAK